ncbi:FN3 associated domain-containing protein [Danxiaibacter flavus]|uniref:FN3 associated domain-containing protein n=1 Tax=Danxiaibacter flavus TaxID=3049108 RepID=A0ABV3ZM74_9BACT|nr:FN3 associated domain-containing protein [Chitinophagaceae bacterium DXS]
MKIRFSILGAQLLLVLDIFIVFLLLFEGKLHIPAWLQSIGRVHPLLLHFPIVILIMAMLLEFFRFRKDIASNAFYKKLTYYLLLSGTLLAGITVFMGLILSHEEGYAGDTLQWHKWTGVAIFFIASIIYFVRNSSWYRSAFAKAGAVVTVLVIVVSGHFGAAITHGDNFISQPLAVYYPEPQVPFEQAVVFNDVIKPVLVKKCAGCHNPDKLKGELILTDSASIMKGGKSGKLFNHEAPELSLLLQRIHLPENEKKHMPPAGRPQLTDIEAMLLTRWIQSNKIYFSGKVAELPERDSLRMVAATVLQPPGNVAEVYDFDAADEKAVAKLNTDYRTILPLAKESPALAVNLYNGDVYSVKQLQELDGIKKQVVSLDLNKLPVSDADLKSISQFENLRHLYLNFTDITTTGLKELLPLQHLQSLAVSGTKINYKDLIAVLPGFKNLKTIAVWNTPLSGAEIKQLQTANKHIQFIEGFVDDGSDKLKLNPPHVENASMVFAQSSPVLLSHPVKGVEIRYTLDGTEPDNIKSPVFSSAVTVKENTVVKAKAYKTGWFASDVVNFSFLKSTIKPDSLRLLYKLNSVHQAEGANTFFDTRLGVIGANNPAWANNWAGVKHSDMGLVALFNKPVTVSSLGLHYMVEEETGILPPGTVQVWGGADEQHLKLLTTFNKAPLPAKKEKPTIRIMQSSWKPVTVSCLKIIATPHEKDKKLLLVDEMMLN